MRQTQKSAPQTQMPRPHCQNTINNIQVMFLLELSYPTTKGPEYPNITKAQENDHKTTYMKMTTVLKEEMNKSLK